MSAGVSATTAIAVGGLALSAAGTAATIASQSSAQGAAAGAATIDARLPVGHAGHNERP